MVIFDGVFLLRPELIDRWDLRIFVSIAVEKTVDRPWSRTDAEPRWRYFPTQQLYFAMVRPALVPCGCSCDQ